MDRLVSGLFSKSKKRIIRADPLARYLLNRDESFPLSRALRSRVRVDDTYILGYRSSPIDRFSIGNARERVEYH